MNPEGRSQVSRSWAVAVIAVLAVLLESCSAAHPAPRRAQDVVLIARFSNELPTLQGIDPYFSHVEPTTLAVVTRATACQAWGLSPVKNDGRQIETHLRVHADQQESATAKLTRWARGLTGFTLRSAPLDAFARVPAAATPGVPDLPARVPCLTPTRR